jgi:3'-phosphoadenosine 5'-phosphosulfate sulfotransferase (PAPS reductase)/FAD synthetase
MKRLFVSFSGGETSALMAHLLLTRWRDRFDEVRVGFANTGQENEETLAFVDQCDKHFGFGVTWVEAEVYHDKRASSGHRVVTFGDASRFGQPFEEVIKKYGIPNRDWPHCTRELKINPIDSWLRSIGWEPMTYEKAIGIRADEKHRCTVVEGERRIYPLAHWLPMTKPDVNEFWMKQPFRLNLTGYQGNCKWCWKKHLPKLLAIMDEAPEKFDFPARMEREYGGIGAEFGKPETEYTRRVFFRGCMSTEDLREMYELNKHQLESVTDDSLILPKNVRLFGIENEPDLDTGCMETCEAV